MQMTNIISVPSYDVFTFQTTNALPSLTPKSNGPSVAACGVH